MSVSLRAFCLQIWVESSLRLLCFSVTHHLSHTWHTFFSLLYKYEKLSVWLCCIHTSLYNALKTSKSNIIIFLLSKCVKNNVVCHKLWLPLTINSWKSHPPVDPLMVWRSLCCFSVLVTNMSRRLWLYQFTVPYILFILNLCVRYFKNGMLLLVAIKARYIITTILNQSGNCVIYQCSTR